ncbi:adenylyltransferase/cytidyltransferase family protein [Arenibacter sp. S6351L]|uniref:adenylyltransferase/cytidyltransferase family protein n=1 Tax=Arenibacter sp. S6351L TaxID=2926407 RepID=UPI001FF4950F|nr:adenylyltransferase/cytidyltransferase family protein [Arenibacter sp. S6351L]MCK0136265.1 adenylyltransferase/cytidyltransferase family protein [Arenibacter sp. S6351L]
MTEAYLYLLSSKYPNWNFNSYPDENVKLSISCKSEFEGALIEMLEIVKNISVFYDNKDHVIKLKKGSTLGIKVKRSKSAKKYKKMYTSGCFDIFHYGHLNILKKSKGMCDHLIVGVSTDELILKEKGRLPVIPFEERIKLVKAISYVDEVIPQVDKNKQRIVDEYNIDAISVGDDWKGRFPKTTCPVEYVAYTANVSRTILKETLQLQAVES